MNKYEYTVLAGLTVVVFGLALTAIATAGSVVTLDDETGLTEQHAIDQFNDEGYVEVSQVSPKMAFTVAERSEDVGVEALRYTNFDTIYLRVTHEESIERTVRFYVPDEYWHPHPDEVRSIDGNVTAMMEPRGGQYSSIEVHFEGQNEVVFPVKRQASIVFNVRDHGSSWLENETGIEVPDIGGDSSEWQYVPMEELRDQDQPTFAIDTEGDDITLQFDAENTADPASKRWRTLPACGSLTGGEEPVCYFEQEGGGELVYVLSQVDDPPDVRFKHDAGFLTSARVSLEEVIFDIPRDVYTDARDWVSDFFS